MGGCLGSSLCQLPLSCCCLLPSHACCRHMLALMPSAHCHQTYLEVGLQLSQRHAELVGLLAPAQRHGGFQIQCRTTSGPQHDTPRSNYVTGLTAEGRASHAPGRPGRRRSSGRRYRPASWRRPSPLRVNCVLGTGESAAPEGVSCEVPSCSAIIAVQVPHAEKLACCGVDAADFGCAKVLDRQVGGVLQVHSCAAAGCQVAKRVRFVQLLLAAQARLPASATQEHTTNATSWLSSGTARAPGRPRATASSRVMTRKGQCG